MKCPQLFFFLFFSLIDFVFLPCSLQSVPFKPSDQERVRITQLVEKYRSSQRELDELLHQWTDNTPCTRYQLCDFANDIFCANVCRIGSVSVEPSLVKTFAFQRKLQQNTPLNYVVLPSTHNSAISKAYGYGKKNHLSSPSHSYSHSHSHFFDTNSLNQNRNRVIHAHHLIKTCLVTCVFFSGEQDSGKTQ